ncbi:MAG TPA: hypothetical protein VMZ11_06915 [Mycobacteriales bacterium]|nr:hypothetical protein [Mycobacteriales bacterium]
MATEPTLDPAAALTKSFTTAVFQPGFSVRLPVGWTVVERDAAAFQAYLGEEDFEITLDHTYTRRESVDQGVARLGRTPLSSPGPAEQVVVGGRRGKAFVLQTQAAVSFSDSGFHTPGGGPLGVMVLPAPDGTTISVFLTSKNDRAAQVPRMRALVDRVFSTLRWS